MIPIFIILICIVILDHLINRHQIKKKKIDVSDLGIKYVNKLHKYGEKTLYWITMIIMILSITDFQQLRLFIFIGPGITFAYRTIMKWKFAKQNRTYLLSAVSCGLFIVGTIVYGLLHYIEMI
ncbi:DUF4181 domain-containing protein [Aquibacillus koreensis]|uniref:DUF4181 domain-containing protein n=1 Tax=Aquibacillus koreensis TaxID=279446 RepID=A0A9X3WJL6_9BACI|nr:DUF4181 domain-containing protein [Aquibacillus koreensis]MCT2534863.1 DUF4181 domain-containing protein [Aquibacillus koreensis]MDC3419526.1 DUF4181 domain-containing protein [Aquibacillus koreensis]